MRNTPGTAGVCANEAIEDVHFYQWGLLQGTGTVGILAYRDNEDYPSHRINTIQSITIQLFYRQRCPPHSQMST